VLLGGKPLGMTGRVVDHRGEQHRPGHRQRQARPPVIDPLRMRPDPRHLVVRRSVVDLGQRQGDFDEFLPGHDGCTSRMLMTRPYTAMTRWQGPGRALWLEAEILPGLLTPPPQLIKVVVDTGGPKVPLAPERPPHVPDPRSEEHTSELQSRENLVCRLLLEKKKKKTTKRGLQKPRAPRERVPAIPEARRIDAVGDPDRRWMRRSPR